MPAQDPRIIKTKRQIDHALIENLAEYPFQKITIDMICRTGMINRSTFYKYYVDKYDLLDKYLARQLSDFREHAVVDFVLASPASVGDAAYMEMFRSFAQYLFSNRGTLKILWTAAIERQVYEEMILIIKERILDLLHPAGGDSDVFLDLYAYMFASNAMSLIHWWFRNEQTVTLEDVIQIMTKNMEEGLFKAFSDRLTAVG